MTQLISNAHPQWETPEEWSGEISDALALGAAGIRVDAEVDSTEPWEIGPSGDPLIAEYLALAEKLGATVRAVVLVDEAPGADKVTAFASAAAELATLGATEIDIDNERDYRTNDPAVYAAYVSAAAPAIHTANPAVLIGIGVISNINPGGSGCNFTFGAGSVEGFLSQVAPAARAILDEVGVFVYHSYDGWPGPLNNEEPCQPAYWWNRAGVAAIHEGFVSRLRSVGWSRPHWCDETNPGQSTGTVTPEIQGDWTLPLLSAIFSTPDPPDVLGWYATNDGGSGSDVGFGAYDDSGTIKPSGLAIKAFMATVTPPVVVPPVIPPVTPPVGLELAVIDASEARTAQEAGIELLAPLAELEAHKINHAGSAGYLVE